MMADAERISTLESDVRLACHERLEITKSIATLCGAIEYDRDERRKRDDMMFRLLHGKDKENPGLIMEIDRIRTWKKRVHSHVNWIWGLLSGVIISVLCAIAASVLRIGQ